MRENYVDSVHLILYLMRKLLYCWWHSCELLLLSLARPLSLLLLSLARFLLMIEVHVSLYFVEFIWIAVDSI